MGHQFLTGWDDPTYVIKNEAIRGFTWEHLKTAFTTYYVGNYAPVQVVSYMIDYSLWGMKASGFLFTNILLHAANGVLLYLLLIRIHEARVWAFFASLLFLLHPVQVESVAWISQRKNVICMFFFLVAFYGYVRFREKTSGQGTFWYLVAVTAFILSLLAKSVAVILPPLLIIYNLSFPDRQARKGLLIDKIPFVLAAAVVAFLALESQSPEFDGGRVHHYYGGSLLNTFFTMLPVLARYLGMIFWPANLSAWYNPPIRTGIDGAVAWSGMLLLALISLGILLWRRQRGLFFWYVVFFTGLGPVSQIVPITTLMNDRYLYFPLLGAAPFLCALLLPTATVSDLLKPGRQMAISGVLLVAVLLCALTTINRTAVWRDSVTLWQDAVTKSPGVSLVHHGLGCALLNDGRTDEAIAELTTALQLNPNNEETYNQLGIAYGKKGHFDKSIELFEYVLKMNPASEPARKNLATARYGKEKFGSR
jgi:hypothetical protein